MESAQTLSNSIVPIFDESLGFIGIWTANRNFVPSRGSLAELMWLAEPTLNALTQLQVTKTQNHGTIKVGHNLSFKDEVFLMTDGEKSPIEEIKSGCSFEARINKGVPFAKRINEPFPI